MLLQPLDTSMHLILSNLFIIIYRFASGQQMDKRPRCPFLGYLPITNPQYYDNYDEHKPIPQYNNYRFTAQGIHTEQKIYIGMQINKCQ